MEKNLDFYKNKAKKDYITTPISVLRYVTELEIVNEKNPINEIDFTKLRSQKNYLIDSRNESCDDDIIKELQGIIDLISEIQKYGVEVLNINPMFVYDFEMEEKENN